LLNVQVPPSEPQILLKVRFLSVDREKEKQLGLNVYSTGLGNTVGTISTGQYSAPTVTTSGSTSTATATDLNLNAYYPGLNIGATIKALESNTVSQVLAEPNVLASNGKQASFLAGGEFPYPMVQGGSGSSGTSISVAFKEYGVRLNFIPTITPRGTIRLQVAPEVSALDFSHATLVDGFEEPAVTSRKVNTEVELADGQSFVIGGLLDNTETEAFDKIPFLGDIPILGKFFQSKDKTRNNTELIVIVTPEIVAPIPAEASLPTLKYPAKFLPPNSGIPMNTPDAKTPGNTLPPTPSTVSVEKLLDSMKPETPLQTGDTVSTGNTTPSIGAAATASSLETK
jgi:pilus assembly protein CpaC